jgi:hypothetical protein
MPLNKTLSPLKTQPIILLITFAVVLFSLSNCKEKFECTSENTVPMPQIMKDYFYYKQGSWWVYVNVKNNTYDSMWVSNVTAYNNRGEGGEGFGNLDNCYERLVMSVRQRGGDSVSKFSMWSLSNVILDNNNRFRLMVYGRDISTNVEWDLNLFFTNNQLETYNSVRYISSVYQDSATIQHKTYNNLIEVTGSNYIHYWLFSKHIGLIKYIDKDSNQWELVKYGINQ